jgi:hypothetical protein
MTDEFILGTLVLLFVLGWFFAIRKTIYHYKLLRNSDYSLIVKFFALGIPYLLIAPDKKSNDNDYLYKKGIRNIFWLVITNVLFLVVLFSFLN